MKDSRMKDRGLPALVRLNIERTGKIRTDRYTHENNTQCVTLQEQVTKGKRNVGGGENKGEEQRGRMEKDGT